MSKFGLIDDEEKSPAIRSISERLSTFPPVKARGNIDFAAIDAAAAQHGFVSRESGDGSDGRLASRRRRAVPTEPTRHLAIRLSESAYTRFVAFADRYKLTYHEAVIRLLDNANE